MNVKDLKERFTILTEHRKALQNELYWRTHSKSILSVVVSSTTAERSPSSLDILKTCAMIETFKISTPQKK